MDLQPLLDDLVPRHWTPAQAVRLHELLWQLQVALWTVHGAAMDAELIRPPETQLELPFPPPIGDQIPF